MSSKKSTTFGPAISVLCSICHNDHFVKSQTLLFGNADEFIVICPSCREFLDAREEILRSIRLRRAEAAQLCSEFWRKRASEAFMGRQAHDDPDAV